jgi:hypothetical protein
MSEPQPPSSPTEEQSEEFTRFDRFTRALFRVDKRDVPNHDPKKRARKDGAETR